MGTLSAQELKKMIDSKEDFILINVLEKEDFDARRIPESINIPQAEIPDRIEKEVPKKSKNIVVYCASLQCQASPNSARILTGMGYTNVWDFEEGMIGWMDAGFSLEGSMV